MFRNMEQISEFYDKNRINLNFYDNLQNNRTFQKKPKEKGL